jgi:hypothetical protein
MRPARVFLGRPSVLAIASVAVAGVVAVRGTVQFMSAEPLGTTPPVVVPGVVGESLCRAQRDLRTRDLTVVGVTGRSSDLAELPATVVSQIPAAEERYRDPEPVILKVLSRTSVAESASGPAATRVHSRRDVARVMSEAGFPEAAVLGIGRPTKLYQHESGACEPVFATKYRSRWGDVTLLQTVGQIVPQGRELSLGACTGQRVGRSFYWHERFYLFGISPPARRFAAAITWTKTSAGLLADPCHRVDEPNTQDVDSSPKTFPYRPSFRFSPPRVARERLPDARARSAD